MESNELIPIKIKNPFNENKVYEIEISGESTILELKEKLCGQTKLSVEEERLVYKGKILKNEDVISSLIEKNEKGVTLILVELKKPAASNDVPVVPSNFSTGGYGLLNSMGFASNPSSLNPSAINSFLSNPMFKEMMKSMLENPQFIENLINNDPSFKQMVEEHPEIRGMLSSPAALSMLTDPQVLNSALNMASRGSSTTGTLSGNRNSFPMPGGVENKEEKEQKPSQNSQLPAGSLAGGLPPQLPQINQNNGNWPFFPGFPPNLFGASAFPQPNPQNFPINQNSQSAFGNNPFAFGFPFNNNSQANFANHFVNQNNQNQINFEEKFKDQLKQLDDMGFMNRSVNLEALKATNGNVDAAIERMLNLGNY